MNGSWIFWIIVGATALQWVYGKIQEQSEVNKVKKQRERARQVSLRTGPTPTAPTTQQSGPTTLTQTELQARRKAQLKALRDRQARAPRSAPQRPAPSATAAPARPTPRPQPRPAPRTSRPAPPVGRAASMTARIEAADAERRRQAHARQRAERERRVARARSAPGAAASKEIHIGRLEHTHEARRAARPDDAASLRPRTREEWRRAIIAAEILAQPVSMRTGD